jgi:hypothetical protein
MGKRSGLTVDEFEPGHTCVAMERFDVGAAESKSRNRGLMASDEHFSAKAAVSRIDNSRWRLN